MNDPFLQSASDPGRLPEAVLALHRSTGVYSGRCQIERGRGWLVGLALRIGLFPPNGQDVPVCIETGTDGQTWRWQRDFDGHATVSFLTYDQGNGYVRERIGGLTIWMRPVVTEHTLAIEIRRLSMFGLPCPKALLPRSSTVEWQDSHGRFRFDVSAEMPGMGRLIRYQGWLTPHHEKAETA